MADYKQLKKKIIKNGGTYHYYNEFMESVTCKTGYDSDKKMPYILEEIIIDLNAKLKVFLYENGEQRKIYHSDINWSTLTSRMKDYWKCGDCYALHHPELTNYDGKLPSNIEFYVSRANGEGFSYRKICPVTGNLITTYGEVCECFQLTHTARWTSKEREFFESL